VTGLYWRVEMEADM